MVVLLLSALSGLPMRTVKWLQPASEEQVQDPEGEGSWQDVVSWSRLEGVRDRKTRR